MTISRVLTVRCALLASPLLVAACTSNGAPGSASSSTVTAEPTTTSALADPEQVASQQAAALVPVYVQTLTDLYADPGRPIDDIYSVAVDPEATTEAGAVQTFRSSGYRQTGSPQIKSTRVESVDLEPGGASKDALPSVKLTACLDVSQVEVEDTSGAPVVAATAAPALVVDLTIVNIAYPAENSWRVSSAPNTQAQTCPG